MSGRRLPLRAHLQFEVPVIRLWTPHPITWPHRVLLGLFGEMSMLLVYQTWPLRENTMFLTDEICKVPYFSRFLGPKPGDQGRQEAVAHPTASKGLPNEAYAAGLSELTRLTVFRDEIRPYAVWAQKNPAEQAGFIDWQAERTGFEPANQVSPVTDLANRRIRPLCHLSGSCSFCRSRAAQFYKTPLFLQDPSRSRIS